MNNIEILQAELLNNQNPLNYTRKQLCDAVSNAVEALQEKADRESHMQWLDDIKNPLEPIKVEAALKSEIMKYEYRKEHKPKDISTLDYTIMHALYKALEEGLREGKQMTIKQAIGILEKINKKCNTEESEAIEIAITLLHDKKDKKICANCNYFYRNHCVCGLSDKCTEPVGLNESCGCWEEKK